MADINVSIVHPTDGRLIEVDLDDTMSAQEVISELIAADFINSNDSGYNLSIKGGAMIEASQSLLAANVANNTTLRVIPATDAGI